MRLIKSTSKDRVGNIGDQPTRKENEVEEKDAKLIWEATDALFSGATKRVKERTDKLKKRNDELKAEARGGDMKTNAYTNEDMLSAMREYVIYRAKNRLIADRDVQIVEMLLDHQMRSEEAVYDVIRLGCCPDGD